MDFHPAANIFPLMEGEEYRALVEDIRQNGLREPIIVHSETKTILDGRNRYRACKDAGVEYQFEPWTGSDPLGFVISLNLHRRHLDTSQRALVAARIEVFKHGGDRKNDQDANLHLDRKHAAEAMNVSERSVADAKKVLDEGATDLVKAVESGEVAVSTAAAIAELPPEEQTEVVARGESEIIATANRLKREKKEQKRQEARQRQEAMAASAPQVPDWQVTVGDITSYYDDFEPDSVDLILTDPPYSLDSVNLYFKLASVAANILKPGGSLLVMTGQLIYGKLFEFMPFILDYRWTLAYMTPGGQSPQIWTSKVNTFWKPVLWFTKGDYTGDWIGDVVKSDANDKRYHYWGQSESGIANLMDKFSQPGDLVVDPFLGGGTTAIVAHHLQRRFIGTDIDPDAIVATKARIAEVVCGRC